MIGMPSMGSCDRPAAEIYPGTFTVQSNATEVTVRRTRDRADMAWLGSASQRR